MDINYKTVAEYLKDKKTSLSPDSRDLDLKLAQDASTSCFKKTKTIREFETCFKNSFSSSRLDNYLLLGRFILIDLFLESELCPINKSKLEELMVLLNSNYAELKLRPELVTIPKYNVCNYLSFYDRIPNGFFDPGRGVDIKSLDYRKQRSDKFIQQREIIVVRLDRPKMIEHFSKMTDLKKKISELYQSNTTINKILYLAISEYVEDVMGRDESVDASKKFITELMKVRNNNFVYLDEVRIGVCRHKATLFKVLCDHLSLKCSLIRGFLEKGGEGAHVWNVIEYGGQGYIADVINFPGEIKSINKLRKEEAEEYYREGYSKSSRLHSGITVARE